MARKKKTDMIESPTVEIKTAKNRDLILAEVAAIEARQGVARPEDLLAAAQKATSPIHHIFEWDDTTAAEKYRLVQARLIMTQLNVQVQHQKIPLYFNLKVEVNGRQEQGYISAERVVNDATLYEQVLAEAVKDIEFVQRKYDTLSELSDVIDATQLAALKQRVEAGKLPHAPVQP